MPAGPVVSNNTPLVALSALERLDLLRDLYDEILIPPAVHAEFRNRSGSWKRLGCI